MTAGYGYGYVYDFADGDASIWRPHMTQNTVGDVMTRDVISVPDFAGYKDIVRVLLEHGISAAPVLDVDNQVAGVVSETGSIPGDPGPTTLPQPAPERDCGDEGARPMRPARPRRTDSFGGSYDREH
jgi:hypothetical protein